MPDLSSGWEFCGDFHTGLFGIPRPLRVSAESEPPALSRRSFARFARSAGFPAWLPCRIRKLSVTYLYTARLYVGDDPWLREDGALPLLPGGGILVSSRIPCAQGGQVNPRGLSHFLNLL